MWSQSHRKLYKGLDSSSAWAVWTDINQWHTWQPDIEYAKLNGAFAVGSTVSIKPKSGPAVKIELIEVEAGRLFTDLTRFPLAKMVGRHEFIERADGLEVVTTMSIEGRLAFLWKKLVAESIVRNMPEQTDNMVKKANSVRIQA
ncbi:MAG: SRPBCC family protein [Granulosicoccus sp.]